MADASSVILGGVLAIAGGIIGQLASYFLQRSAKRKELYSSKAELLVQNLYAHSSWLETKRQKLFQQQDYDEPSPLNEARMIQKLYFPEMSKYMLAVMQAEIPMVDHLGKQRVAQMQDLNSWIARYKNDEYLGMYRVYLNAFNAFTEQMARTISDHAGS